MYPKFLSDNSKAHWEDNEIFEADNIDWIHAFIKCEYSIGMHSQGFFEINIVLKGNGRHYIENQSRNVEKGDVFIIPPYVRHGYVGAEDFDVCHVLIHKRFLDKYIADLQTLPFFFTLFNIEPLMRMNSKASLYLKISDTQFNKINYLIDNLITWSGPANTIEAMMCNSNTLMLLTQLCSIYAENYIPNAEQQHDSAFMQSVSFIYERYYEKVTIERLSKIAKLSRTAYITLFKRIMGTTPAHFLLSYRLEAAKNMLLNTELPIAEIAEKTGFYDAAHFIRSFAKEMGCPPMTFKKQIHRYNI